MDKNYRITDNMLLVEISQPAISDLSYMIKDNQYVLINDLNNTVWFDDENYKHYLNKVYNDIEPKITPETIINYETKCFKLYLKQFFNFGVNTFGYLVTILDTKNNDVLCSKIIKQYEFNVTSDNILINGSFWNEYIDIFVSIKNNNILMVQITEIINDINIDETGYINNYPTDFIPLITEKPVPDYINTTIKFTDNQYLYIEPYTTELTTLENSIKKYFDIPESLITNIDLYHNINWGNTIVGYRQLQVKNLLNQYQPITIGLNLNELLSEDIVDIYVDTYIEVDGKLMIRNNKITTNLVETSQIISNLLTHPDTNYIAEIINKTELNQTIIDEQTKTKVVTLIEPIYLEIVNDDIIYQNKYISFNDINFDSIMTVKYENNNEILFSKNQSTSSNTNNQVYFDLGELKPIDKDVTFTISKVNDNKIIKNGTIKVNK